MSIAHFDPLLCASLHNQIISIIAPAARTQYRNTIVRNFFAAYGEPAEAIRDRLSVSSTPLVSFLENIDIALPPAPADGNPGVGVPINFAPHLALPSPWMFEELNPGFATGDCRDEHENFVVLYGDTNLCTWSTELMPWPLKWYPLERALRLWLSLYESAKFRPSIFDASYSSDAIARSTPSDLSTNLQAYHALLTEIQARSPNATIGHPGLIDLSTLDRFNIHGFVRAFLLHARRPSFSHIAPGIRIPTTAWLQELLAQDQGSARYALVRSDNLVPKDEARADPAFYPGDYIGEPLPLFPGPAITSRSPGFDNGRGVSYSEGRSKYTLGETSGLYIWPEAPLSEDYVVFVMPHPVGGNGHVAFGNPGWEVQGGDAEHMAANDALYQHGHCPFGMEHAPRLFSVLRNWAAMVRSGRWAVGEDGVEGGIGVFEEADEAERASDYRLGACFDRDHE